MVCQKDIADTPVLRVSVAEHSQTNTPLVDILKSVTKTT